MSTVNLYYYTFSSRVVSHYTWRRLGVSTNQFCRTPSSRPQLLRCLTHTGVGVSPIHPTAPHPYTQRGLTHRTFRVTLHHLTRLSFVISAHACPCPPLPHTGHLRFAPFVISTQACLCPPLPHTRHLCFVTLVISALLHSSSPPRHFRHLQALTLVISKLCHSPSPSSDTRHLPRDND